MLSDVFEAAHDVIGEIADRAAVKVAGPPVYLSGRRGGAAVEVFDDVETLPVRCSTFLLWVRSMVISAPRDSRRRKGAHAEKCIASIFFSAFDGFEQEGVGLAFGLQRGRRRPGSARSRNRLHDGDERRNREKGGRNSL